MPDESAATPPSEAPAVSAEAAVEDAPPTEAPAAFGGQTPIATVAGSALGPTSTATYCPSDWVKAMVTLPSRQSMELKKRADETGEQGASRPDDTSTEPPPSPEGGGVDMRRSAGATQTAGAFQSSGQSRWKRKAAMMAWTEQPGQASDYILNEKIGGGGQGEVWRAWQTSLSREVAVKKVKTGDIAEFLMEAFTTAELDHPNIVPVHDLGRIGDAASGDQPLLAMKLARGTAWNELIQKEHRANKERMGEEFVLAEFLSKHLRILTDVCNAVAYAHSKGIIHRDLKPHQVMVGKYGEVFLMDWGLAVSLKDDSLPLAPQGFPRRHTLMTATNQTGTPAYMAPEQTLEKAQYLGRHTDIYLLGAILYELISGRPPHPGATASEAFKAACRNQQEPLPADCPPELAEIVAKSMATAPAQRQATVEEFRDAVEAYLSGSTKRRDSLKITEEIVAKLQGREIDSLDYSELSDLRIKLERGLQFWPENPRAIALRDVLSAVYARRAADAGDLRFAEYQAESLPETHPQREALLEMVREKRLESRREKRQKVIALADYIVRKAFGAEGTAGGRSGNVEELRETIEKYLGGSSKRRDSQQVADEIGELFDQVGADSLDAEELLDAQRQLEHALKLWPENDLAKDLREVALGARAWKSLDVYDLHAAESLAQKMAEDNPERAEIEAQIRAHRQKVRNERRQRVAARHKRRQRRIGVGALVGLLLLIVAGFVAYKSSIESAISDISEGLAAAEIEAREKDSDLRAAKSELDKLKAKQDRAAELFRAMATNEWQTLRTAPELELFRQAAPERFEAMLRADGTSSSSAAAAPPSEEKGGTDPEASPGEDEAEDDALGLDEEEASDSL